MHRARQECASRKPESPVVSHNEDLDLLLVRVTQFLFKMWKQSLKNHQYAEAKSYDSAFYAVAEAKRLYRQPMVESRDRPRREKGERMRAYHAGRG
jgi:hypothetical protein